jgi:hypothetical protein
VCEQGIEGTQRRRRSKQTRQKGKEEGKFKVKQYEAYDNLRVMSNFFSVAYSSLLHHLHRHTTTTPPPPISLYVLTHHHHGIVRLQIQNP